MLEPPERPARRKLLALVAALLVIALPVAAVGTWTTWGRGGGRVPPAGSDEPETPRLATAQVDARRCVRAPKIEERIPRSFRGAPRYLGEIAGTVEQLRDLKYEQPVDANYLSDEELSERVVDLTFASYSPRELDDDRRALVALGVLKPGESLRGKIAGLLGGQVTGFYVPETDELVVGSEHSGGNLPPLDELTLAHELEHALADQVFVLPLDDDPPRSQLDAALARRAVVEGDATLVTLRYMASALPVTEQLDVQAGMGDAAAEAARGLADTPHYLERAFSFPYDRGLAFVCHLFARGGWPAVDRAYKRPPTTSAQVLWPKLYRLREKPQKPRRLRSPRPGWKKRFEQPVAATDLLWLFEAPGDERGRALEHPIERAAAWAGGEMALWTKGSESALGIALVERRRFTTLCASMSSWYQRSFSGNRVEADGAEVLAVRGKRQSAVLSCDARAIRLGIAPSVALARRVIR